MQAYTILTLSEYYISNLLCYRLVANVLLAKKIAPAQDLDWGALAKWVLSMQEDNDEKTVFWAGWLRQLWHDTGLSDFVGKTQQVAKKDSHDAVNNVYRVSNTARGNRGPEIATPGLTANPNPDPGPPERHQQIDRSGEEIAGDC